VLETGEPWVQLAFPFIFEDKGETITTYWDFEVHPMRSISGEIEGIMALAFEVSTRIRLEQTMAEERALTERIVENAPAGIAFLDGDLVYRRLNQSYATLMDMTVEQIVNKSIYEVFPGATDQFEPLMREVMATGVPYVTSNFPFKFMLDGKEKMTYWDFTYQPMPDEQGRTGILILEVEVSDRQEKERLQGEQIAQLKAMDRYKDEFLSVISHELRTPLNFITGFASTLEDGVMGPLNHRQEEAVSRILNGADRMLKLVDDLLDFAKMQSGRFELTPAPTAYGELVEEVLGLLMPLADQKGLVLGCDVMLPVQPRIDGGRVSQVLTNLVGNALKFTDANGQVSVRAYVDGDVLVTEVMDTGCGISPDQLPRLFHRFQQLDMSNTRKAGGTGLGLAISKAIVEAHGGTIGVTSVPGEGSTFWFRLPLEPAVRERGAALIN
jgi:signal transduction histidine kinase